MKDKQMKKDTATYRNSASPVSQTSASAVWTKARNKANTANTFFKRADSLLNLTSVTGKAAGSPSKKDTFLIQKWMNKCT